MAPSYLPLVKSHPFKSPSSSPLPALLGWLTAIWDGHGRSLQMSQFLCVLNVYPWTFSTLSYISLPSSDLQQAARFPKVVSASRGCLSSHQSSRRAFSEHQQHLDPAIQTTSISLISIETKHSKLRPQTPTMAGGKGKSSGGKSSGGKVGVDGSKKQQSHSSKAGLQVSIAQT
jgi:hypothetical protein